MAKEVSLDKCVGPKVKNFKSKSARTALCVYKAFLHKLLPGHRRGLFPHSCINSSCLCLCMCKEIKLNSNGPLCVNVERFVSQTFHASWGVCLASYFENVLCVVITFVRLFS